MRKVVVGVSLITSAVLLAQQSGLLYENNFEKAELDKVPDEFLVLDGQFAVRQDGDNKFLELPGAPLDTFGAMFGPAEKDGIVVSARILGTAKGRRFPAFAISLNGVSGYKLQVSAAKKQIELFKGDTLKVAVPYEWGTGQWTHLKLQVRKTKDGGWKVEGSVWKEGSQEPSAWMISFDETDEPVAGRAAVWGNPFSGTPIRFDDLREASVSEKP